MTRFARIALLAAFAFVTVTGLATHAVSAKTYVHSHTVWFHDAHIGDGDEVKGDLNVVFGSVTCDDGGTVDGNVNVYFGTFEQLDGCQVGGNVNQAFDNGSVGWVAPWVASDNGGELSGQNRRLFEQLAWDVVIVFAFLLFPLRVRIALDRVERHPGLSAAIGTLALIAIIPIAILLAISIIGIPLIVLEFAALFGGLWIGQAAVSLLVGRRLYELARPHTTPAPLAALLLGLVVVSAAEILPVVGWAVIAIVWLVGLGAAILAFVRENAFSPGHTTAATSPLNRPA